MKTDNSNKSYNLLAFVLGVLILAGGIMLYLFFGAKHFQRY